jgi:hypothetical protein
VATVRYAHSHSLLIYICLRDLISLCMYGAFTSMCACSAVFGAVAFLCCMYGEAAVAQADQHLIPSATSNVTASLKRSLFVLSEDSAWPLLASFDIFYPLDFLLVTNVKLLFIHRIYSVAQKISPVVHPLLRALCFSSSSFNFVLISINCINVAGIVLRWLSAHHLLQASVFASSILANSIDEPDLDDLLLFLKSIDTARTFASYQLTLEAVVLTTMAVVRFYSPFYTEIP